MLERLVKNTALDDLTQFPAVALLGPRQVGKTTLAREIVKKYPDTVILDLERPSDLNKLTDAETFLQGKKDILVCIDEVQLRPDLFPLLRALIDDERRPGRFLVLGSSSPQLLRQSSETLAGRISYIFVNPFTVEELDINPKITWQANLWRGGFPDSVLATNDTQSQRWRENYIKTFLERDLRQFGINLSPQHMQRLWQMCAHAHGQVLNYSKFGQSLDQTHPTIKSHIDIFESTFMVRRLLPYEINIKKRLVKSPKLYIRDSGIFNTLLGLESFDTLFGHPSYGSCWEGFAIENILTSLKLSGVFGFYRTQKGDEIDLVVEANGKRFGFEFKTSSAPKLNDQNYRAMNDLELAKLFVITPNAETYQLKGAQVIVTSLKDFLSNKNVNLT